MQDNQEFLGVMYVNDTRRSKKTELNQRVYIYVVTSGHSDSPSEIYGYVDDNRDVLEDYFERIGLAYSENNRAATINEFSACEGWRFVPTFALMKEAIAHKTFYFSD